MDQRQVDAINGCLLATNMVLGRLLANDFRARGLDADGATAVITAAGDAIEDGGIELLPGGKITPGALIAARAHLDHLSQVVRAHLGQSR